MTSKSPVRPRVLPDTSHRDRSRPISDLVRTIETENPALVQARGISSAALRAGDMIRAMRKAANLSQSDMASAMKVSQARISELEAGFGPQGPTWDVMERVADVCQARIGWFASHVVVEAPEIYESLAARGMSKDAMKITEIGGMSYLEVEDVEDGINVIMQPIAISGV